MELEAVKRTAEEAKTSEDRAKADQLRANEKKEKELAALRKADAAPRKKVTKKNSKPSTDEIKKKEKEEKARQEEEARGQLRRAEFEKKEVQQEVAVFNQRLMRVKNAFSRTSGNIINTLRLSDTNNDGTISLNEFMTAMQRVNVQIPVEDLLYVYEFIDENKDGKLQYKELSEVLRGTRNIDAAARISSVRKAKGQDHGYTPSELANIKEGSKNVSFDKNEIRSAGEVSGMSELMRRSDTDDRKVPALTDEGEHRRNIQEIRDTISKQARSFEEILSQLGTVRPDQHSKITFDDFYRAIIHYCGPQKYSGYQLKFAFKEIAKNVEKADPATLAGAYISVMDFKDSFYPGKTWNPLIGSQRDSARRAIPDDQSSATSVSVALSTIMAGKTQGDLHDARDKEERKMLMEEQIKKNQFAAEHGDTILDEFEKYSEASQPLDEILAIRANDPKLMKPGQSTSLVNNAFMNTKFFRQAEVSIKARTAMQARYFDTSIQVEINKFCEKIDAEIAEAALV